MTVYQFTRAIDETGEEERDLLTLTEICVAECVMLLDRHGVAKNDPIYFKMLSLSNVMNDSLLKADGQFNRVQRLRRAAKILSKAFPKVTVE